MPPDDDIVSLEDYRKMQENEGTAEDGDPFSHRLQFLVTEASVTRLQDLQDRLRAESFGQVIAAAVDVLDSCLRRIEEGKRIVSIDADGISDSEMKDPRFPESGKPKTPA